MAIGHLNACQVLATGLFSRILQADSAIFPRLRHEAYQIVQHRSLACKIVGFGSGRALHRDAHYPDSPLSLIGGQPNLLGGIFKISQKPPILRDRRTLELSIRFKSRTGFEPVSFRL